MNEFLNGVSELIETIMEADETKHVINKVTKEVKTLVSDLIITGTENSCDSIREICNCKRKPIARIKFYDNKTVNQQ